MIRPRVETEDGRIAWALESYDFLAGDPLPTANPNLWRQSQLGELRGLLDEPDPGFAIVTPD